MAALKKTGLWAILVFFCIALAPSQLRAEEDPITPTPSKWFRKGCIVFVVLAGLGAGALAYLSFSNTTTEEEGDKQEQKQENLGKEIPKAKEDGLRFNMKPMP